MDRKILLHRRLLLIVNGLSQHIENTPQRILSHRYGNRRAGRNRVHAASQTIRTSHSDTFYRIIAKILSHLHHQPAAVIQRNLDGLVDFRNLALGELDVDNRTDDLCDFANILFCHLVSP